MLLQCHRQGRVVDVDDDRIGSDMFQRDGEKTRDGEPSVAVAEDLRGGSQSVSGPVALAEW